MSAGGWIFAALYAVSVVLCFVTGALLFRHREKPGAVLLSVTVYGALLNSMALLVATVADSTLFSTYMLRLTLVGIVVVIASMFLFALEYTGREQFVTWRSIGLLSIEPLLVVLLTVTNPGKIMFRSFESAPSTPHGVAMEFGTAFWLHTGYSYVLLAAVAAMILEFLVSSTSLYRGQALALFGGVCVPWIVNVLSLSGGIDAILTPIGFIVTAGLFSVAIVRYQLVDLTPIAREHVFDTVSDGIVVVDRQDRIVDLNETASRLLAHGDGSVVGADVATVLAADRWLLEEYRSLTDRPDGTSTTVSTDEGEFDVRARPIEDTHGRHVGWVFVIADVTERRQREQKLHQQKERLDQFADVVSRDLRELLDVAERHTNRTRETGEPAHLEEVETSYQHMEAIIGDILTLTREREAVTDLEPVLVRSAARRAWEHADTGSAELRVRADGSILADEDRLARLFENLYRNLLGDAPEATTGELTISVLLRAATGEDTARILVTAEGAAISEEPRDRRLDRAGTAETTGRKLRLSIAEQIAAAHGWQLHAEESETREARFVLMDVESGESGESGDVPGRSVSPS